MILLFGIDETFSWKKLFSNKVLGSRSHYFINFEWVLGIEWFW